MSWDTLGFVGLGRMGGPIARRLKEAGYELWGFDAAGTEGRLPEGAHAATSVAELGAEADVVLLSLPHGAAGREVCEALAGAENLRTETVVDLATLGMRDARECAEVLGKAGVAYVDAPVSGGVAGATTGKLAMMIGAPQEAIDRVEPVLEIVALRRFHVGLEPGQGQAAKLLNNYVSSVAVAATSEAVVFGSRVGLDMEQMVEILNASSGRTTASTDKLPRSVIPRTYDFGFAAAAMRKDAGLYLENSEAVGTATALARANDALWDRFLSTHPDADFTYIHRYLEEGGS